MTKNDTSGPIAVKIVSVNDSGETNETPGTDTGVLTGAIALHVSGLNRAGGKFYYVKITPSGGISPSADRITLVRFTFTRP